MLGIEDYIGSLTQKLKDSFGERLIYVGLQGSYLRGEATSDSDREYNIARLPITCKAVFFILQNMYYWERERRSARSL